MLILMHQDMSDRREANFGAISGEECVLADE
jgi:hypothetical protein